MRRSAPRGPLAWAVAALLAAPAAGFAGVGGHQGKASLPGAPGECRTPLCHTVADTSSRLGPNPGVGSRWRVEMGLGGGVAVLGRRAQGAHRRAADRAAGGGCASGLPAAIKPRFLGSLPALSGMLSKLRVRRARARGAGGGGGWASSTAVGPQGIEAAAVPRKGLGNPRWPGATLAILVSSLLLALPGPAFAVAARAPASALAMVTGAPSGAAAAAAGDGGASGLIPRLCLWLVLFVISAALHSAEIAITTLYPWKVKEFAEEEGEKSPFQILNKDITRVLTTILVATTVCTIYNAALFTNLAIQMFGAAGLAYSTAALTAITLFFGELLPKALGVNNAEMVARSLVPVINTLAFFISPVGKAFSFLSKLMLRAFGFKSSETGRVSEEELRLIVTGAKLSGGIESQEGTMIEGVLDLQDTKVSEIMRPRVEVVAIDKNSTMMDLYHIHEEFKYSRIPVFEGEIDRISGVVLSKDLLDCFQNPQLLDSVKVADIMETTYFVPETMSVWNVLQEMRKRRLHMAIVVDEYGGTAGVVTLEDILEEVVGEIYDEEDEIFREEEHYINLNEDGSYTIHGMADLEDVFTSLDFAQVNEDDLREFGTISGYLCNQAGEIPAVNDYILVRGYIFTVTKADERKIEEVHARAIATATSTNKLLLPQDPGAATDAAVQAGPPAGGPQVEMGLVAATVAVDDVADAGPAGLGGAAPGESQVRLGGRAPRGFMGSNRDGHGGSGGQQNGQLQGQQSPRQQKEDVPGSPPQAEQGPPSPQQQQQQRRRRQQQEPRSKG